MTSQEKAFQDFAGFAAKLKGDEKSEAQTFLFHLLEAFNHDANTLPEGCTFEYRVRFPGDRTKFAVAQASAPAGSGGVPPPVKPSARKPGGTPAQPAAGTVALQKIRAVAGAARALRNLRHEIMDANGWSLRELYKSLETPGENRLRTAHAALDAAVRAAYGMKPDEDILAFLLKLNLELAAKEAKGEPIAPPGLPAFVPEPEDFVSQDCVTIETP